MGIRGLHLLYEEEGAMEHNETQGGDPAEETPAKPVDDPNLPEDGDPEDFDEEPVDEAEFGGRPDEEGDPEEPNDLSDIEKEFDDSDDI